MTTHGHRTPAQVRAKVLELSTSHTCHEIADLLGITSMRCQRILDRLDDDAAGITVGVQGLTAADQQRPFLPVQHARPAFAVLADPSSSGRDATDTAACGTTVGYWRHRARDEKPCDDCRSAYNAQATIYRENRKNR